jgi:hypothetical protein
MLIDALKKAFELRSQERLPYLHRYFSDRVEPGEAGRRLFLRIRELEVQRVGQQLLVPIGLRLVAVIPRV